MSRALTTNCFSFTGSTTKGLLTRRRSTCTCNGSPIDRADCTFVAHAAMPRDYSPSMRLNLPVDHG